MLSTPKILRIVLLAITIVSTFLLSYTTYVYIGVHQALATVEISILDFNFTVINSSLASTNISFTIDNPSEFAFWMELSYQELYLNGEELGETWLRFNEPVTLSTFSNISITIKTWISGSEKVALLTSNSRHWYILLTIWLYPPMFSRQTIIERFSIEV